MPAGGGEARADQLATLQGLAHERLTSPETAALLARWVDMSTGLPLDGTSAEGGEDEFARALLRETWRDYTKASQLPNDFVMRLGKTCSLAQQAWVEAKRHDDFLAFLPHLTQIVSLKKEEAAYRGTAGTAYDRLLDIYEPNATEAQLTPLFDELKRRLISLLHRILSSSVKPDEHLLCQQYAAERQLTFGKMVLAAMGYDFDRGRLDVSAHPFTTSFHPTDVRVTTRVSEEDFTGSLFSCIHEGGHGLYDQGLPKAFYGTPLGEAVSLGIHESQSRLWENLVGLSLAFWEHFYPLLQKTFPDQFSGVPLKTFYGAVNLVKPSFIRVDADEVTYNLHILLRFEIERDVMENRVQPEDLPEIWRDKMKAYLGIVPATDREGVLQDVHWSLGAIGYFPTYTLGNLYSVQFFNCAKEDVPDMPKLIAAGNLTPVKTWLNEHIHRWGRTFTANSLVARVTGKPLSLDPFMAYLEAKYGDLYHL